MVLLYIHHSCCKGLTPSNYGNLGAHENEGVKNWDPDSLKGREEVYGYVMNCNDTCVYIYIYIHAYIHSHGWGISRKEFALSHPQNPQKSSNKDFLEWWTLESIPIYVGIDQIGNLLITDACTIQFD